jgi:hypothetical protein
MEKRSEKEEEGGLPQPGTMIKVQGADAACTCVEVPEWWYFNGVMTEWWLEDSRIGPLKGCVLLVYLVSADG